MNIENSQKIFFFPGLETFSQVVYQDPSGSVSIARLFYSHEPLVSYLRLFFWYFIMLFLSGSTFTVRQCPYLAKISEKHVRCNRQETVC